MGGFEPLWPHGVGASGQMCDLKSKFEKNRTKTAVAIVDDRYFEQTHTYIDRQTDLHSNDYICPVPCIALDRQ